MPTAAGIAAYLVTPAGVYRALRTEVLRTEVLRIVTCVAVRNVDRRPVPRTGLREATRAPAFDPALSLAFVSVLDLVLE